MNKNSIACKVVAASVVVASNRVLVLRRGKHEKVFPGLWELPGGKRENGEKVEEALIRECREETGIETNNYRYINSFTYGKETETVQLNFLTTVDSPYKTTNITISHDHDDYAWLTQSELKKYNVSKETMNSINRAFKML